MTRIKELIALILHGAHDTSTNEGRSKERSRRIALTAFTGTLAKVLAMGIPLFTVRVTYAYLGEEIYGLWSAMISFFAIFHFADLGLGNGLKTRLSQAYGSDDKELSKELISSTYAVLLVVSVFLMTLFLFWYPRVNWSEIVNAESEKAVALVGGVVFAVIISRILNIPVALVQRTQMALQEGYRANIWVSISYVLSLISVYMIAGLDLGPLVMIWASSMIVVIVSGFNMFVYYRFQRKEYCPSIRMVNYKTAKSILKTGLAFFVLSILTTIALSLDNFIVARTISLNEAATYSILFKVTHMIGGITTMLSAPMWAANGEAFARGDIDWIKQSTRKMSLMLLGISLLATIGLIIIARPFFRIWIGEEFEFSMILLVGMCVMQILLSVVTSYFMVLNALGIVRKQISIFAIYTPISFILKYRLAMSYGPIVIPWVGALSYFLFILIPVVVITNKSYERQTLLKGY